MPIYFLIMLVLFTGGKAYGLQLEQKARMLEEINEVQRGKTIHNDHIDQFSHDLINNVPVAT